METKIIVEARDVNDALRTLGGIRERAPIEVRPVADGWVLHMRLLHEKSFTDYRRNRGITYELDKICIDLVAVARWIQLSIGIFNHRVEAWDAGFRLDEQSLKSMDDQILDWWLKMEDPNVTLIKPIPVAGNSLEETMKKCYRIQLEAYQPSRPTIVGGMGTSDMTREVIHEVLGKEVPFDSGAER